MLLDAHTLPAVLPRRIEDPGAAALEISVHRPLLAGSLRWDERYSFDRLLAAQATAEDATLVTVDTRSPGCRLRACSPGRETQPDSSRTDRRNSMPALRGPDSHGSRLRRIGVCPRGRDLWEAPCTRPG